MRTFLALFFVTLTSFKSRGQSSLPSIRPLICFTILLISCIVGCRDKRHLPLHEEPRYSDNQRYLFQLLDDYKKDYFDPAKSGKHEEIRTSYQYKMQHFLVDSLERFIDSMTVTVDSVIQDGWHVTTQFHTGDIEFKYGLGFQESMPPADDSLYKFMKNLVPGKVVTVAFVHLGGGELNYPDDQTKRTMRIFAYPEPLQKQ